MHVVGARFGDLESAVSALTEIRAHVPVPRGDVAVRPLGSTRYEEPARDFVLAGRFEPADVSAVVEIIGNHGGLLVTSRPDVAPMRPGSIALTGRQRDHRLST